MRWLILGVTVACLALTGCNLKFAADAAGPAKTPTAGIAPSTAPMIPVEITATTVKEFEEFVAAQKGKVVVVRCWYHGCPGCVGRFPEMPDLHSRFGAYGVVCATLNINQDEWAERDELVAFLEKQKAGFRNFHLRDSLSAHKEFLRKYRIDAVPATLLWDKAGQWQPNTPIHFNAMSNAVSKLLAAK